MKYLRMGLMALGSLLALCAVALAPAAAATCNGAPWTADAFFSGGCQKVSVENAGDNSEATIVRVPTLKGRLVSETDSPVKHEPGTAVGVINPTDKNSGSTSGSVSVGVLK